MVNRKPYGLENEKLAGNKPRKGMPMVLDDRLISKQYIKGKVDDKVDDTAYGSSWDAVTDVAPSKNALYDYLNSLSPSSDMWTKKEDTSSTNIRAYKTGNYAIGPANFTSDSDWEKLYVAGSIKATGDFIMATDGSKVGPSSGYLTLHSTNGALLPTKFMIGTGTASVPLEISLAGSTPTVADGTGIIQAGADSAANLGIGVDKIQARDGSAAAAELKLNTSGGTVTIGSSGATTTISGNLNVVGTATTTLSETVNIKDSNILLNSDLASDTAPSVNAGITVERGSSTDSQIIWNETDDKWQVSDGSSTFDLAHSSHAPVTLGTNTASALSLSGQQIALGDKFVQIAGDSMTGALTIGDAGNQTDQSGAGTTNLIVYGGPSTGNPAIQCNGHFKADTKSFDIPHPIKKNMRLVHGTLEGPEFGMYQRGTLKSNHITDEVPLPAYWGKLVSDYTVSLTPHGNYNVWLVEKHKNMFEVKTSADAIDGPWSCEWIVVGRRNDYKLEVEQ
jgi:hypothetical protein